MKNHHNNEYTLSESLAQEKPFGELTNEEQKFVLEELGSQGAYEELRTLLLATRAVLADEGKNMEPDSAIHANLRRRMVQQYPATSRPSLLSSLKTFFTYNVPAYQAVTAVIILVTALTLYNRTDQVTAVGDPQIIYQHTVDTQFIPVDTHALINRVADSILETIGLEPATATSVLNSKTIPVSQEHLAATTATDSNTTVRRKEKTSNPVQAGEQRNIFRGLENLPALKNERRGRSARDDSSYTRFIMTAAQDTF